MIKDSKEHLSSVNEGYFKHMFFALRFSFGCLAAAFYAAVHAIFPFAFKTTASKKITELYLGLCERARHD
jgi:hypothetical protein